MCRLSVVLAASFLATTVMLACLSQAAYAAQYVIRNNGTGGDCTGLFGSSAWDDSANICTISGIFALGVGDRLTITIPSYEGGVINSGIVENRGAINATHDIHLTPCR